METKLNVMKTRELGVCLSCEMCLAVCPNNAINMEYQFGQFLPNVDCQKCTNCGLCLENCTGIDVDTLGLRTTAISDVAFDGPCLSAYTAQTKEFVARNNSTSGGIVTSLIIELIKSGDFNTAFVLPFDYFKGQPARLKATDNITEINECAGSKYIPSSVYEIVKTLKDSEMSQKFIVVGTGCQVYGIKKYLSKCQLPVDNILFLGLFCDRTLNFDILRYFEESYAKSKEKLIRFQFRSKERHGWPGNVKLSFDSGRQLIVNRKIRMQLKSFFQLKRCLFCTDKLNQNADISFGDCYIEGKGDHYGRSSVIIRTKKGQKVFEKYANYFTLEKSSILAIMESQKIAAKKENLEFMNIFIKENGLYPGNNIIKINQRAKRRLSKLEKLINLGKNYRLNKIKLHLSLSKLNSFIQTSVFLGTATGTLGIVLIGNLFRRGSKIVFMRDKLVTGNIIIVGAGLSNKGAQAMTFTAVDQLKRSFPNKLIYLMSSADYVRPDEEKSIYNFVILPWNLRMRLRILNPFNSWSKKTRSEKDIEQTARMQELIRNADCFVDLSGYRLFSEGKIYSSISYLLDIIVAKRFSIPYYILPQSMGPFNCNPFLKLFLYPLIKLYLPYARKIFIREEDGLQWARKFTSKNIVKGYDIVLTNKDYKLNNIYSRILEPSIIKIPPNSVAIIPNQKVIERTTRDFYFSMYYSIIERLLLAGKTVYIMRHSFEDIELVYELKKLFQDDSNVKIIADDINAVEFEYLVKQFDFVVASRYHSIVHAYKNIVPSLVIGWAKKYSELLDIFEQGDYLVDIRDNPVATEVLSKLEKILLNYTFERKRIGDKLALVQKTNFPEID